MEDAKSDAKRRRLTITISDPVVVSEDQGPRRTEPSTTVINLEEPYERQAGSATAVVIDLLEDTEDFDKLVQIDLSNSSAGASSPSSSTAVERHAFMEFFSPPRVAPAVRALGLHAQHSLDIETGHDFLLFHHRAEGIRLVQTLKPQFVMLSPPCTMYSALMRLWNFKKMPPAVQQQRFATAHCLLDYAMQICQIQHEAGRSFCFEHPCTASSWQRPTVQAVALLPGVTKTSFDQCRVGFTSPGPQKAQKPIRKRATLLSSAPAIKEIFQPLQCTCTQGRMRIKGTVEGEKFSTRCALYPPLFCKLLAQAVQASF